MALAYASEKSGFDHPIPFSFRGKSLLKHANLRLRLALVQMKLMLGMILNKFSVTVDVLQTGDEMESLHMAVLAPKGGRCLLRFSVRRRSSLISRMAK